MDENQRINSATNNGIEIGKKQGIDIGKKQGINIGEERGRKTGEKRLAKLTSILIENNKYEELKKICSDDEYRDKLFKKYEI